MNAAAVKHASQVSHTLVASFGTPNRAVLLHTSTSQHATRTGLGQVCRAEQRCTQPCLPATASALTTSTAASAGLLAQWRSPTSSGPSRSGCCAVSARAADTAARRASGAWCSRHSASTAQMAPWGTAASNAQHSRNRVSSTDAMLGAMSWKGAHPATCYITMFLSLLRIAASHL